MGQILTNLPDDLKHRWQRYCTEHKISMNKIMIELIIREMNLPSDITEKAGMTACRCLLCGTEWESSKQRPVACPACKSYRWDDAEFQAKRIGRVTRQVERESRREQKQLYNEYEAEYKRINWLTPNGTSVDVARKIGITPEEMLLYFKGIKPITPALIEMMKRVQ